MSIIKNYFLVVIFLLTFFHVSTAQDTPQLEEGYYVVVAAYAPTKIDLALKYMQRLNNKKGVGYGYSPSKNLYFVYTNYDRDFRESIKKMRELRKDSAFYDAWVYVAGEIEKKKNTAPLKEKMPAEIKKDSVIASKPLSKVDTLSSKEILESKIEAHEKEKFVNKSPKEIVLKDFQSYFNIYNAANGDFVSGDIQIIDAERLSLLDVLPGHNYHVLPDPNNATGEMLLIAEILGYRKKQININFKDPYSDTLQSEIRIDKDKYIVNFEMVRYHVGDIFTMFNVYFYKDAAMMLPKSEYELKQLLAMMRENPNYRIKIHGHTNGNSHGKIITMGEDKNYFSLTADDVEKFGSAKKLSKERALILKEYLVQNGIVPDRMEIKAWGGRRMLYDKNSPQADENVRVEIEILDE